MIAAIELKSPLSHQGYELVSLGNSQGFRRQSVIAGGTVESLPVLSGAALRGAARRAVFRDLFERLEERPSQKMYACLANGGTLEKGEKVIDPDRLRELREALPPLSAFGAAYYSGMLPGHWSTGICYPYCDVAVEAGLVPRLDREPACASDLIEDVGNVRHVEREHHDPGASGVTPMPVMRETLVAGTILVSEQRFAPTATDLERSCVAWALSSLESLGGCGAQGFGRVSVELADGDPGEYCRWLDAASDLEDRLAKLEATWQR